MRRATFPDNMKTAVGGQRGPEGVRGGQRGSWGSWGVRRLSIKYLAHNTFLLNIPDFNAIIKASF